MILLCIRSWAIPVAILLPIGLDIVGFLVRPGIAYAFGRTLRSGAGSVRATIIGALVLEAIPLVGNCPSPAPALYNSVPIRIVGYAVIVCAISMGLGAAGFCQAGPRPSRPGDGCRRRAGSAARARRRRPRDTCPDRRGSGELGRRGDTRSGVTPPDRADATT